MDLVQFLLHVPSVQPKVSPEKQKEIEAK